MRSYNSAVRRLRRSTSRFPILASLAALIILLLAIPTSQRGICAEQPATPDTAIIHSDSCPHSHADTASAGPTSTTPIEPPNKEEAEGERPAAQKPPGVIDTLLSPKYLVSFGIIIVALVLLLLKQINLWVRIGFLVLIFVLYGLDYFFPLHPSPMCAVTKLFMFKFTQGKFFAGFVGIFLAIFIPSLIGRKLFCGWVCPLGAVQELVNKVPFKPRFKQFHFGIFNGIRFALLAMFVLTFFWVKDQITALGGEVSADVSQAIWRAYSAYSVYDPINFFELLHWNINTLWWIMMAILVIASLMLYRPFCYAVCPVGALSWLLEKIAPARVRVDKSRCQTCDDCVTKSPCPTIKPLRDGKPNLRIPDCTSCGECLRTCSREAIRFGFSR